MKRVVVLGAGFAGLNVAKGLARAPVEVTVIDRSNHHLFQPLLYQVATAALAPSDIASPIRSALRRQSNARTLLAEARAIDLQGRRVLLDTGEVAYDWLVIATGATHSYFGNDDWEDHAPGLKTIDDALRIRRNVLEAFERAEALPEQQDEHLTFVVVGAGPTGVELAGALAEIARHAMRREFRTIDPTKARVLMLEGGDRVLPGYPEDLSESARRQLEQLGVDVRTSSKVTGIDARGVKLDSGERIESRTVLWAAGVKGSELSRRLDVPLDDAGRIRVGSDLSISGWPNVFVAGDLAKIESAKGFVPGVAPAAIQAGKHVARTIRGDLHGKARAPFVYRDRGSLATIGWARAVADLGRVRFSGFTAWLAWMLIHVVFLVGFRNRLFVLIGWAWSYLTLRRGARLITSRKPRRAAAPSVSVPAPLSTTSSNT